MRARIVSSLLLAVLLLLGAPDGTAQGEGTPLTPDQVRGLLEVRHALALLDDLGRRGVVSPAVADAERGRQRARAAEILGGQEGIDAALADVEGYLGLFAPPAGGAPPRVKGWFSFVHILWVMAGGLLVVSLGWLTRLYLVRILAVIPPSAYEGLIYLACVASMVGGRWFAPDLGAVIALPGCIGLIGGLYFTQTRHGERIRAFFERRNWSAPVVVGLLLAGAWAPVAIAYESRLIGTMSVAALQSALGFSVLVAPLCVGIGFRSRDVIPRSMASAFVLLGAALTLEIQGVKHPTVAVFLPGAIFLGTFVYFVGLLIVSSKLYPWPDKERSGYPAMQILTVVSGLTALAIGSVWEVGSLRGVGGSFFFLYVLEKFFELPWKRAGWAWGSLCLALLLYGAAFVAREFPQYFLFDDLHALWAR